MSVLLLPLLVSLASPQAQGGDAEWIGLGRLPGFVVGHRQRVPGAAIAERVPEGETVQDWTRMVTVIRLERGDATPDAYTRALGERWGRSCPGGRFTVLPARDIAPDRPVEARYDCLRNPATGKPETMFMRTSRGREALHVVQVAFRRVASDADMAWARGVLSDVWLCSAPMAPLACAPAYRGL